MSDAPSMVVSACWAVFVVTWGHRRVVREAYGGAELEWGSAAADRRGRAGLLDRAQPERLGAQRLWTPTPSIEWLAATIVLFGCA